MWQLTCETDLFGGKAIWLRPGSRHLLGRTSARTVEGEQVRFIDHKNVSRKHLLLQVSRNSPGDSSQIHVRSTVTATDNSKSGTFVNGSEVLKTSVELNRTENRLQLGTSDYVFHIKWVPIVLTCTKLSKSLKAKEDPVGQYRSALEQTDIKLVATYLSNLTTHVIASKRNSPAVLQALGQAKWVVNYQWLAELGEVVKRSSGDAEDEGQTSSLEQDIAGAWPSELDYLVDSGTEPVPRDNSFLKPDPRRSELFSGLIFVFLTQTQYDSLMPVITVCGGKAFVKDIDLEHGEVSDVVSYLQELAGSKSGRAAVKNATLQRIQVIRPADSKENEPKWLAYNDKLVFALGRPTIAQNQFLDIILMLDTSLLKMPAAKDSGVESEATIAGDEDLSQRTRGKPSQVQARLRKPVAKSRFDDFEDFDVKQIAQAPSASPEPTDEIMDDVDDAGQPQSRARKRSAAEAGIHLPGLAAMKKQRLENGGNGSAQQPIGNQQTGLGQKQKSVRPEQNVEQMKNKLQAQLQQQEEERAKREEELKVKLDELDLEQYKDCAQVEEFEVELEDRPRDAAIVERAAGRDWNPAWNGRANFKAFRPQGQSNGPRRPKVFVQLVEASDEPNDALHDDWSNGMDVTDRHTDKSAPARSTLNGSRATDGRTSILLDDSGIDEDETLRGYSLKRPAEQSREGSTKRQRHHNLPLEDDVDDNEDGLQFIRKRR